ncbi:MAG: porin family protein [Bacteroidales bacterium]
MRRILFITAICLLTGNVLSSQHIYLTAGLSASQVSLSYADVPEFYDTFPVLAPNIGVYYESEINSRWSLRPGITVNKQGRKMMSEPTSGYYVENKYLISYIEAPLLFTYKLKRKSRRDMHMHISAGPFYSYGYFGKFISTNGAFYEEENIFVGSDDLYRYNYGALFMFTGGFDNHRLSVYISPGLRDISQEEGIFNSFRTLRAGLSYNFILHTNPKNSIFVLKKILY